MYDIICTLCAYAMKIIDKVMYYKILHSVVICLGVALSFTVIACGVAGCIRVYHRGECKLYGSYEDKARDYDE